MYQIMIVGSLSFRFSKKSKNNLNVCYELFKDEAEEIKDIVDGWMNMKIIYVFNVG